MRRSGRSDNGRHDARFSWRLAADRPICRVRDLHAKLSGIMHACFSRNSSLFLRVLCDRVRSSLAVRFQKRLGLSEAPAAGGSACAAFKQKEQSEHRSSRDGTAGSIVCTHAPDFVMFVAHVQKRDIMTQFSDLGLSSDAKAVVKLGYEDPTPCRSRRSPSCSKGATSSRPQARNGQDGGVSSPPC